MKTSINFYKETDFKETPIGRIPTDWEVIKVEDISEMKRGFSYRSSDLSKGSTRFRFLTINDFEKEGGLKLSAEPIYLREDVSIGEEFFVKSNDIFIANTDMSRGFIIGAPLWIRDAATSLIYSMDLTKLILNENKVNGGFLFYLLSYKKFRQLMKSFAQGTNILHLNHDLVRLMRIPLPPSHEQKAIVEVLSIVDEAVHKINEIIAKTERLKKGLMQELLTKGIGHKEFKDTEIGKIPKEWEVVKLFSIAEVIMGQSPPSSTYNKEGNGLPFLQGKMEFGDIYPSPMLYCSEPIKIAEPNDILISVRAPVGDVNLTPYKLCIGRGLAAIRFHNQDNNYLFYFYYLQKIKNVIENMGKGSTFKAIIKGDLENLKVSRPPPSEQQKIAEILHSVDSVLHLKKKKKEKLIGMKRSLMDLLLTGKVRVRV